MSESDESEAEEFTEALVYIGFNRLTAEAIVQQGFRSPEMLLTVSEDSLSDMARQVARSNPPKGYILISSLHVYHGSISRYGHFMLLALTGGRIVFSDRVVFR